VIDYGAAKAALLNVAKALSNDARPANKRYNRAGLDVSPAINGYLGFSELDDHDKVSRRFVEAADVPHEPWKTIVTTQGVLEG
jgi:hypothetical protein